jgi:hypothetical protein
LKEGEEKLTDALRQFHGSIVQAREPTKRPNPPLPHNIAIKAAAGLGKTTQAIAELFVGQIKSKQGLLISNYVVFKYKHADSRKAANVLIANSVIDPKKKLEELLGVDVRSVEKVSE